MSNLIKYCRNGSNFLESKISDTKILLNLENDKFIKLNMTASFIWDCLSEPRTFDELCLAIKKNFDLNDSDKSELRNFLDKSIEIKLIKEFKI